MVKHNVTHHILTEGVPTHIRHVDFHQKEHTLQRRNSILLRIGIIRPLKSTWSSLLHTVLKKTPEQWQPCGDYSALNAQTVPVRYPLPYLRDFSAKLNNCTIFSTIDLVCAHNQIPLEPVDVDEAAIATPFGLYDMVRMPFGIRNAGSTFHRLL